METPITDVRDRRRAARARDLTLHAFILACAVWTFVGADVISPGQRGRFSGAQKGNDFVQFYVAGTLAREGQFHALVDPAAFREAQAPFSAPGSSYFFPPVYGPQLALFFAPVSWLPYFAAYAAWVLVTLLLTFWSLDTLRCLVPALIPWRTQIVAATLAFPPLGYLVLDGQLSALALAAITLAALALARGRKVFAGAALGLLGYKVSLLAPALAVLVLSGEWSMAASALAVVALQLLIPIPLAGAETLYGYVHNTAAYAAAPDRLVRNVHLMASFRTFWSALLPAASAKAAYVVSAAGSIAAAAVAWRRTTNPVGRIGVLTLAVVLASPHVFLYDLLILAPAFVASAGILLVSRSATLRWSTWLAYVVPLAAPIAALTGLQLVTIVLAAWLAALATAMKSVAARDDLALARGSELR